MKEQYREDYLGEYVVTKMTIRNGKKILNREWIENPLTISNTSNRAACISTTIPSKDIFYKQIENSNGGNLSKLKMQTYGVDDVWEKMTPNFTLCKDTEALEEMIKIQFTQESIVYTSIKNCISYPEEFYLVPHNKQLNLETLAVWIACFDGHKEIFFVGYDYFNQKIVNTIAEVMHTYKNVTFYHVTNHKSPDEWKSEINFKTINQQDFISYCDI